MTAIILLIFLLPLGLGATLIFRGVRGYRIGDHPVCRNCGFDLYGQPARTIVCGECGARLSQRDAVVIGHRKRQPTFIIIGLCILLPILFVAGFVGWGLINDIHLMSYAPTRFVTWRAVSSNPAARLNAFAELNARFKNGNLSQKDLDNICDAGLNYQADRSKPWDPAWGDWLETCQANGKLSDDRLKRYLTQAWQNTYVFRLRQTVRRGDPLPFQLESHTIAGRNSSPHPLWIEVCNAHVEWLSSHGNVPNQPAISTFGASLGGAGSAGSSVAYDDFPAQLPDGIQNLHFTGEVKVGYPAGGGAAWGVQPIVSGTLDLPASFTLVPATQSTVTMLKDPASDAAVRKILGIWSARMIKGPSPQLEFAVDTSTPPIAIAADVFVRSSGVETKFGSFTLPAGAPSPIPGHCLITMSKDWKSTTAAVDVIIRSNPATAVNSIDVIKAWDGEIVFKNVPVK